LGLRRESEEERDETVHCYSKESSIIAEQILLTTEEGSLPQWQCESVCPYKNENKEEVSSEDMDMVHSGKHSNSL